MKSIWLNHAHPQTIGLHTCVLLLAGVIALVVVVLNSTQLQAQIRKLQQANAEVAKPNSTIRQVAANPNEQTNQDINAAIRQINLPWVGLFQSLERIQHSHVILRSIEPSASSKKLRMTAATDNVASMMAYVAAVSRLPELTNVEITSHDVELTQGEIPINFVLEATWQP